MPGILTNNIIFFIGKVVHSKILIFRSYLISVTMTNKHVLTWNKKFCQSNWGWVQPLIFVKAELNNSQELNARNFVP